MKVWIDQDLCTGDGLCEEIAPAVFTLLDDGLAYVKDGDKVLSDPGGAEGIAPIVSASKRMQAKNVVICITVLSFTALPVTVPPPKKLPSFWFVVVTISPA